MSSENAALRAWEPCPRCGTSNAPYDDRCDKCGRRLSGETEWKIETKDASLVTAKSDTKRAEIVTLPIKTVQTNDREVSEIINTEFRPRQVKPLPEGTRNQLRGSVHAFRNKQLNRSLPLQFEEPIPIVEVAPPIFKPKPEMKAAPTAPRPSNLPTPDERVVKPIKKAHLHPADQTELAFAAVDSRPKNAPLLDVAPFQLRLLGHAIDFSITLAAFMFFLIPIRLIVGHLSTSKLFLGGVTSAYVLLVFLYGLLFLAIAGATPSMKLLNLHIVNFDGFPAKKIQRVHRFLGVIASVGSFFVGLLWAAVDEEGLAWQDRISKTFLSVSKTASSPEE